MEKWKTNCQFNLAHGVKELKTVLKGTEMIKNGTIVLLDKRVRKMKKKAGNGIDGNKTRYLKKTINKILKWKEITRTADTRKKTRLWREGLLVKGHYSYRPEVTL